MITQDKLYELSNDINKHCPDLAENFCGDKSCVTCLANALLNLGYEKKRKDVIDAHFVLYLIEHYGSMLTWSKEDVLSEIKRQIIKEVNREGK